jgi:hypothetical protein
VWVSGGFIEVKEKKSQHKPLTASNIAWLILACIFIKDASIEQRIRLHLKSTIVTSSGNCSSVEYYLTFENEIF